LHPLLLCLLHLLHCAQLARPVLPARIEPRLHFEWRAALAGGQHFDRALIWVLLALEHALKLVHGGGRGHRCSTS